MEEGKTKTIVWDSNSEPPKNYIWAKDDNGFLEFKDGSWEASEEIAVPGSGSDFPYEYIQIPDIEYTIKEGDDSDTVVAHIEQSEQLYDTYQGSIFANAAGRTRFREKIAVQGVLRIEVASSDNDAYRLYLTRSGDIKITTVGPSISSGVGKMLCGTNIYMITSD